MWRRRAGKLFVVTVLAAMILTPRPAEAAAGTAVVMSANWSGYLVNSGPRTSMYVAVRGAFVQPAVSRGCPPESDLLTWVGIGGFNQRAKNRMLIQVGTTADYDIMSGTTYSAWYQYLRTDLRGTQLGGIEQTRLDVRIRPTDAITLAVAINRDAGTATFEVRNATTGQRAATTKPVPNDFHDLSTADFVSERTGGIGLARFGVTAWTDASVRRARGSTGGGGWRPLGDEPGLTEIHMISGLRTIAVPDPLGSPTRFTNRWKGCR